MSDIQKIIYQEALDARKQQQDDVSLVYNKFNWIVVSDVLFISLIIGFRTCNFFSFFSLLFFVISLFTSLLSLKMKSFKRGPVLNDLIKFSKEIEYHDLMSALNEKIINDIEKNKEVVSDFNIKLNKSITYLLVGVVFVFIYYILK